MYGSGQGEREDELQRRRRRRRGDEHHDGEEPIVFGWMDVLAFTIAAYQVLFPFLLAILATGGILYFLFWLWTR